MCVTLRVLNHYHASCLSLRSQLFTLNSNVVCQNNCEDLWFPMWSDNSLLEHVSVYVTEFLAGLGETPPHWFAFWLPVYTCWFVPNCTWYRTISRVLPSCLQAHCGDVLVISCQIMTITSFYPKIKHVERLSSCLCWKQDRDFKSLCAFSSQCFYRNGISAIWSFFTFRHLFLLTTFTHFRANVSCCCIMLKAFK